MSKLHPTVLDAYHQWVLADLWMNDANTNPGSRAMAHAMVEQYFAIIEEIVRAHPMEIMRRST